MYFSVSYKHCGLQFYHVNLTRLENYHKVVAGFIRLSMGSGRVRSLFLKMYSFYRLIKRIKIK